VSAAGPASVRRWSEEVAADPASPSFLPLAAAYREQRRPEAALRLCLRGLGHHPSHVEAHHLLGLLYLERGDELKAFDEWDIALRLDAEHHESRREIARLCARRGDREAALRHLARLREAGQEDAETVALLGEAEEAAAPSPAPPQPGPPSEPSPVPSAPAAGEGVPAGPFARAALTPEVAGAVVMDAHGLALLEAFADGDGARGAEMAAHLSGASDEAERTARHLELGGWRSILIETGEHVVHVSPVGEGMLAIAVRRGVPMGWAVRHAGRVRAAATALIEPEEG
jgi:predicted regulator of Ras-like GTPase activity (Roadblock/LC7/MglB family)